MFNSSLLAFTMLSWEIAVTNTAVTHIAYCLHTRNYKSPIKHGRSKIAKLWKQTIPARVGFYIGKKYTALPFSLVFNLKIKLSRAVA